MSVIGQQYEATKSGTKSLSLSQSGNLFNKNLQCTPVNGVTVSAKLYVEALAQVQSTINYGVALTGTIVPPHVDNFGILLDASATTISAGLTLEMTGGVREQMFDLQLAPMTLTT